MFSKKMDQFKLLLEAREIDLAIITDQDNIYYLTGYYDYLHMDFGRPTILIIHNQSNTLLITPAIDANSARALAKVDRIEVWNDGVGNEWIEYLKHQSSKKYTDEYFEKMKSAYTYQPPQTKEALLYREIFNKFFKGCEKTVFYINETAACSSEVAMKWHAFEKDPSANSLKK